MTKRSKKTNKVVADTQKKPGLFKRMGKGISDATCATGRASKKLVTRKDPNVKETERLKKLDAKIKKETEQYAAGKKALLAKAEGLKDQAKQIEELAKEI